MPFTTSYYEILCPCCGHEITVGVEPEEKPVFYPTDRAHPGSPAMLDSTDGCDCWEYLEPLRNSRGEPAFRSYEEECFDRIQEQSE